MEYAEKVLSQQQENDRTENKFFAPDLGMKVIYNSGQETC